MSEPTFYCSLETIDIQRHRDYSAVTQLSKTRTKVAADLPELVGVVGDGVGVVGEVVVVQVIAVEATFTFD